MDAIIIWAEKFSRIRLPARNVLLKHGRRDST